MNGQTAGGWTFGNGGGVAYEANDWGLAVGGSRQRVSLIQSCIQTLCGNTIFTNMVALVSGYAVCVPAKHHAARYP